MDESYETLLQLFEKHNDDMLQFVGINKYMSTYKKYVLAKRRLEEFMKCRYNISDIAMRDITLMFIRNYELYLRTNCRLSNNVAAKMIQYLKKIVMLAHNLGIIQANPFINNQIRVNRVQGLSRP